MNIPTYIPNPKNKELDLELVSAYLDQVQLEINLLSHAELKKHLRLVIQLMRGASEDQNAALVVNLMRVEHQIMKALYLYPLF